MKQLRVSDEVWVAIRKIKFMDGMKDYDAVLRVMLGLGGPTKAAAGAAPIQANNREEQAGADKPVETKPYISIDTPQEAQEAMEEITKKVPWQFKGSNFKNAKRNVKPV